MESETTNTNKTPILEIAWMRYAIFDAAAVRRTRGYYNIRSVILWLSVIATLFAILTTAYSSRLEGLLGLVAHIFFIATPIVASIFAAFATRFYSNGSWLIMRAGAEEIKREIYLHRTVRKNKPDRDEILEKKLADIQRQMYQSLGGEFSFEPYEGKIPPYYDDNGFDDLNGEEYFRLRLEDQFNWHNNKLNGYEKKRRKILGYQPKPRKITGYKKKRRLMVIYILSMGGMGAILAALGEGYSILVALTASMTAALIGWQELNNYDTIIRNYSKVVIELTILYDHWKNLQPENREGREFEKLVEKCEKVLWAQHVEFIRSQQEVLKEENLEEQAKLIEGVLDKSVETTNAIQREMGEAILESAGAVMQSAQEKIVGEFKETLGKLAEEASSELVQQEIEAMSHAVTEAAQTVAARASTFTSSLAQIADEFAHVEIGRNTSREELNAILARYPKTGDVKG